jgi:hypothetical protein
MRNYVNLAVPTMPLLVADKRGAAETKIIAGIGAEHGPSGQLVLPNHGYPPMDCTRRYFGTRLAIHVRPDRRNYQLLP